MKDLPKIHEMYLKKGGKKKMYIKYKNIFGHAILSLFHERSTENE